MFIIIKIIVFLLKLVCGCELEMCNFDEMMLNMIFFI